MRLETALIALLALLLIYRILKGTVKKLARKRIRRQSLKTIRRFRIRIERFKLTRKKYIKFQILKEREIWEEMDRYARRNQITTEEAMDRVEEYIDEIVPFFNILSYYKFGYATAHFLLNLIYNVVIDEKNLSMLKRVPKNSVVIYIMNHRSNADYLLVAYMLAEHIALSYAVGEWARIWPLEYIFKSFGSYFIRRKFREPLYHKVLEKYVQLISKNGITQGIFVEGGLSRDGRLRDAKVGLMDYIVKILQDDDFTQDVIFVPTAINYDRVLEDLNLVREIHGAPPEKKGVKKLLSGASIIVQIPRVIIRNGFYYIFKGIRKYGYTSVALGRPISLRHYLEVRGRDIFSLEDKERKNEIKLFVNTVMKRVGEVIPVTPVPLVSLTILKDGRVVIPRTELLHGMRKALSHLVQKDARIVRGDEFLDIETEKARLRAVAQDRTRELLDFEHSLIETEEMDRTLSLALEVLSLRNIAWKKKDDIVINPNRKEVLTYYSNSIIHLFDE
ncbi:MAG: 1-acyl-sn-glycerol-3-phosphate acyltransferase [Deltaproteobacteria bacterium]|nr:1-acyl-sn-glycerol-3-phosphate acyltransferase [Candidatus Zymogenaceae bacterium]